MLTPLFKKSKHVGIVEFLVTVAFGFVGLLIVLMESFPPSLVWLLSPFCQCTFLIGIAQVREVFNPAFPDACFLSTSMQCIILPWILPLVCKKLFYNKHGKGCYLKTRERFILISFIFSPFLRFSFVWPFYQRALHFLF